MVVVGAGAFGAWTAYHLQRTGATVTLLDAWGSGNSRSSSGGETRVIRAVYGSDRFYTEMVGHSLKAWKALETRHHRPLFRETGLLWMLRSQGHRYLRDSVSICSDHGFPVEPIDIASAQQRWPQINFRDVDSVYFEQRAGVLSGSEACCAVREAFLAHGGRYRIANVLPGDPKGGPMVNVRCADGARISADHFVFACGPWLGTMFPEVLGPHLQTSRQEVFFFGTPPGSRLYHPDNLPVWLDFDERLLYGLPDTHGRGFKTGDDSRGELIDPSIVQRTVNASSVAKARSDLAHRLPELANAPLLESRVCQYTNTPNGHLLADRHPVSTNVWFVGGGSGHGFKISPKLGQLVAHAMLHGKELPHQVSLRSLAAATEDSTQFER